MDIQHKVVEYVGTYLYSVGPALLGISRHSPSPVSPVPVTPITPVIPVILSCGTRSGLVCPGIHPGIHATDRSVPTSHRSSITIDHPSITDDRYPPARTSYVPPPLRTTHHTTPTPHPHHTTLSLPAEKNGTSTCSSKMHHPYIHVGT